MTAAFIWLHGPAAVLDTERSITAYSREKGDCGQRNFNVVRFSPLTCA